ncbi:MAG: hypothetical protein AMXMBFR33_70020 [Candidatus Xenobia bacterium]
MAFVKECLYVDPPRVAQRCYEDKDARRLSRDQHRLGTEVDLKLVAWRGLKPNRRLRLNPIFPAKVCHGTLYGP